MRCCPNQQHATKDLGRQAIQGDAADEPTDVDSNSLEDAQYAARVRLMCMDAVAVAANAQAVMREPWKFQVLNGHSLLFR